MFPVSNEMNPEDLQFKPEEAKPVTGRAHYWKFVTAFLTIVVVVFVALWGLARYERYTGEQQVKRLADAARQAEKDDYAASMTDTYGGKTPKETIQLYISALEKRDFTLATQYFIGDSATRASMSLRGTPDARLIEIIADLKKALSEQEQCDAKMTECSFNYPISIDLKLYPNGIWKLGI